MKYFFLLIILFLGPSLRAQEFEGGRTSMTSKDSEHRRKKLDKDRRLLSIIITDPRKKLIGNKCMEQVRQKMGFEYLLQPKGQPGNRSGIERFFHNFGVKVALMFRNGPFYGIRLKKKREDCMTKTGDYAG